MSFEKEFDKIIKQKAQQGDFPFDESNWMKAEQMIDAQRKLTSKQSNLTLVKTLVLIGVVAVSSVIGLLLFNQSTRTNKPNQSLNKQIALANNPNSIEINHAIVSKTDIKNIDSKDQVIEQAKLESIPSELKTISKDVKLTNELLNDHQKMSTLEKNNFTSKQSHDIQFNNNKSVDNEIKNQTSNVTFQNAQNTDVLTNQNSNNQNSDGSNNIPKNEDMSTISNFNSEIIAKKESLADVPTDNNLKNTLDDSFQFLNKHEITGPTINDTNLVDAKINYMKIYDDSFGRTGKIKTHFLNIGLGLNYLNGWSTPNGRDGKGLNYYAVMNYGFYISRNLAIGAGIDFYNIQNIAQPFYTSQKTEYSFGSTNTYTSITANNLKYLGLPLKLYYDINRNNILSIGVLPSVLVGVNNNIQYYNLLNDGQKTNLVSTSNNSLYNGLAQKNMQITLGFKTKLTSRLWLEAEAMGGMSDLFINNTNNQTKQIPVGIRLGVHFDVFNK